MLLNAAMSSTEAQQRSSEHEITTFITAQKKEGKKERKNMAANNSRQDT